MHARSPRGGYWRSLDTSFASDGLTIAAHLASPPEGGPAPAIVVCHGFPTGPRGAAASASTFPELADRIARECGWYALSFNFRGTGVSEGDFSVAGWRADLRAAVDHLESLPTTRGVWLCGVAEGGTLALMTMAAEPRVRGCVTLAAPRTFKSWSRDPARLLEFARRVGMVRTPGFPASVPTWGQEVAAVDVGAVAGSLTGRPVLLLVGTADAVATVAEARELVERIGSGAEYRMVGGAGHELRHDPRAVASVLGCLDRQVS